VRTLRAALCLAPRRGALRPPPSRAPPSKELPRPDGAISPAPRVSCASPCRAATLRSLPLPYMTDVLEPLGVSSATCPPQVRPRRGGAPGPSSTHPVSCGRCAPPLQRSASFCLVVLRRCCSSALATFAACESPRVSGRRARTVPPSCSTTHGREADSAPSSFLLANKSCFWHRRKRGKSLPD
jgi:hypothetical protein